MLHTTVAAPAAASVPAPVSVLALAPVIEVDAGAGPRLSTATPPMVRLHFSLGSVAGSLVSPR